MSNLSENKIFNQICRDIVAVGGITTEHKAKLAEVLKGRFSAAYDAVKQKRVIKYVFHPSERVLYMVKGKEGEYLILPFASYCSCPDFYFRVIDYEIAFCYHLIAQKLADILETYTVIDECDENFIGCMERWQTAMNRKSRRPDVKVKEVRQAAMNVLFTHEGLPINTLLERIHEVGFHTLTRRHLANILISDRAKRFRSNDGLWTLNQTE
jgi:predicted nucleic acid-binding Zn finger protein